MIFKKLSAFKFSSYLAYVLPLVVALYFGLWATTLVIIAAVIFGFLYHWFNEKRFLAADASAACALIIWDALLCYWGQFKEPYFIIALALTALAFYYYLFRQNSGSYSLNHGMWHFYGALITLFCVFVFVL